MAGTLRVRRSRGALSGVLLVLLGIWGALIPFVGPYFHYAYAPDRAWTSTSGRLWLEVLPGVVTLVGGAVVLISRFRPAGLLGAWLAALGGAWFAIGDLIGGHFAGIPAPGTPVGGATRMVLEQIGFFTGLGVVIVFLAALALGRFTVVGVRDAAVAEAALAADAAAADADASAISAAEADGATRADTAPMATPAAGTGAAADLPRRTRTVRPVPVFRGRDHATSRARVAADQAGADAADAEARAAQANAEAGQPR